MLQWHTQIISVHCIITIRMYYCLSWKTVGMLTRIIQSLYYSPASRSESADRGRSIIQAIGMYAVIKYWLVLHNTPYVCKMTPNMTNFSYSPCYCWLCASAYREKTHPSTTSVFLNIVEPYLYWYMNIHDIQCISSQWISLNYHFHPFKVQK